MSVEACRYGTPFILVSNIAPSGAIKPQGYVTLLNYCKRLQPGSAEIISLDSSWFRVKVTEVMQGGVKQPASFSLPPRAIRCK